MTSVCVHAAGKLYLAHSLRQQRPAHTHTNVRRYRARGLEGSVADATSTRPCSGSTSQRKAHGQGAGPRGVGRGEAWRSVACDSRTSSTTGRRCGVLLPDKEPPPQTGWGLPADRLSNPDAYPMNGWHMTDSTRSVPVV